MGLKKYSFLIVLCISILTACSLKKGKFIPAPNEPVTTSFTTHSGLILIHAEVNGILGTFLFDNGFSYSGINTSFAKKANVTFNGSTSIRDANSRTKSTQSATVKLVEIQGQKILNTSFYQINTDLFFPCKKIDGVIGASIINQINWKIDFENKEIISSSKPFKEEGFPLNILFTGNNSSLTEITVLDQTYTCKIDLGSSSGIKLDSRYSNKSFEGLSAEKETGITSLSAHGLGNVENQFHLKTPIDLLHKGQGLPKKSIIKLKNKLKYQGYLGLDFFKPYQVVINSDDKKYWLKLRENQPKAESDSSYGLSIYPVNNLWKVIRVNPNDSLVANIQLMSEVSHIDSISVDSFKTICDYKNYFRQKAKKRSSLKFTLKEGEKVFEIPYHQKVYGNISYQ